jgi:hypothetical protein
MPWRGARRIGGHCSRDPCRAVRARFHWTSKLISPARGGGVSGSSNFLFVLYFFVFYTLRPELGRTNPAQRNLLFPPAAWASTTVTQYWHKGFPPHPVYARAG